METKQALTRAEFRRRMAVGTRWSFEFDDSAIVARGGRALPVRPGQTREVLEVRSRDIVLRTERGSQSYLAHGVGESYEADGAALVVNVGDGARLVYRPLERQSVEGRA